MNKESIVPAVTIITIVGIIAGLGASIIINETSTVETPPTSTTGVKKAEAEIFTGSDGLTVEQRNIKKRLEMENQPGSIKHLYIISAMSGQVILYSTVDNKVTSSGKRLSPYHVAAMDNQGCSYELRGIEIKINGEKYRTSEVLQDDGTYGSSISYLYWWDSQGRYHQHYISGGQIVHISDQPIAVKSIIINLEQQDVINE